MKILQIVKFITIQCVGALVITSGAAQVQAASSARHANGRPDLNGVWQVLNEANWNLEPHIAAQGAVETLGAIGAAAPGIGVVVGGSIPYRAEARAQRLRNSPIGARKIRKPSASCLACRAPPTCPIRSRSCSRTLT